MSIQLILDIVAPVIGDAHQRISPLRALALCASRVRCIHAQSYWIVRQGFDNRSFPRKSILDRYLYERLIVQR